MCGISGFAGAKVAPETAEEALKLTTHRGSDASDYYLENNIFLGHNRLAIIDLSNAANQPMHSFDNRYVMVYNGEIYNFKELRKELSDSGVSFRTQSDSEVIVNGFSIWGNQIFSKLNGIFAVSIWHKEKESLTLARDRYGVKPLYYSSKGNQLAFGSEMKTIIQFLPSQNISKNAFREFLDYGNPLGEQTLFESIEELKPGTVIEFHKDNISKQEFWAVQMVKDIALEDQLVIEQTHRLLEEGVKRQLVSDVPVGVFLSGGIDSSLVTAFASKNMAGKKLSTYTAAFDFDIGINELESAKKAAQHFGTDHHELFIEGKNLPYVVDTLIYHHDAPFSDAANIPLYLLTKALSGSVKVILQGDGGDEFFAGYRRYQLLQKYGGKVQRSLFYLASLMANSTKAVSPRVRRMLSALGASSDVDLMARLLTVDYSERNTFKTLNSSVQQGLQSIDPYEHYSRLNGGLGEKDIVQKMLLIDTQTILTRTFLEKVDKSTMANSVEVRVPLLDNNLTDFVMGLPSHQKIRRGEKKWLLKKALRGTVPDFVLDGKKTGFGVPYENWIKEPLYEMYKDALASKAFTDLKLFDRNVLDQYMREHKEGVRNNGFILWKVFQFSLWVDKYKMNYA